MEITVKTPRNIDCDMKEWPAKYTILSENGVTLLRIKSRSSIDVVVAEVQGEYYISVPNFGVAIPSISSLSETLWITEKLMRYDLPAPDAVTVAQVLKNI